MPASAHIAAIVTILALLFYIFTAARAGIFRAKYNVAAPAMTGHPTFERAYRVQANTMESLIMFLPLLWIAAMFFDGWYAGIAGILWVLMRVVYSVSYMANPEKRGPGAILTNLTLIALLIMSILGLAGIVV